MNHSILTRAGLLAAIALQIDLSLAFSISPRDFSLVQQRNVGAPGFKKLHFVSEEKGSAASNNFSADGKRSTKPQIENEWGIPSSDSLEPLGPTGQKDLPKELPNGGRITLVGAGPGDPDLLTVSAYKLLTKDPNSLVIADRLVSKEILDLIPGQVKIARKLPGCAELAQEEIYWWVHQGLQQGRHVIRLKIGDPFVFGRGGEEVLKFRDFGLEATVVPVSIESNICQQCSGISNPYVVFALFCFDFRVSLLPFRLLFWVPSP
jgi:hypothetical protein